MPPHLHRRDWRQKCVNLSVNQFLPREKTRRNAYSRKQRNNQTKFCDTQKKNHAFAIAICEYIFERSNENYYVTIHTFHSCCEYIQREKQRQLSTATKDRE